MPDSLGPVAQIAPPAEPGPSMRITGHVRYEDGRTAAGIIVYAYHTNAAGLYPVSPASESEEAGSHRHGALRGWARTDEAGRYRFDSIRPGGYPGTRTPEHVHMHVIEPGRCTYYIDDIRIGMRNVAP
jgi:protocatechuate 3,4-dioxygenase beta subunit